MQDPYIIIGALMGGLGLFLLAVEMMTNGLRQAAGAALRNLLSKWTRTPFRGVLSGFFMTAIVQSSSAVTVASIGFVNAGLLSMRQALGIIYGANIGTTITGWLVTLVGFKINIMAFALPMIGVGMILRLIKTQGRLPAIGTAIVGFGMFFFGIDVLRSAFESMTSSFDIASITLTGIPQIAVFLLVGIAMTILTQSSSASIALTITAAATGIVGIYAAAAMVIGANVGTTSTAALASIGATSQAKRVALAQVIFNVGTGIVALLILPLMFLIIEGLAKGQDGGAHASVSLALFHTIFNILGVLIFFPLNKRMANFLEKRFVSREEKHTLPKYLDKTIAATPVLAVNALVLELIDITQKVSALAKQAISTASDNAHTFQSDLFIIRTLSGKVSEFIVSLERNSLTEDINSQLATLLRIDQNLLSCANDASLINEQKNTVSRINTGNLNHNFSTYRNTVLDVLAQQCFEEGKQAQSKIKSEHHELKARLLREGTNGVLSFEDMLELIELINAQQKLAIQWIKAMKHLQDIQQETGSQLEPSDKDDDGKEVEVAELQQA